jgi:hypothetical protein
LSSINNNGTSKRVQLSLDNFFSRPKGKRSKEDDIAAYPTPDASSPPSKGSLSREDDDEQDSPPPTKKPRKRLIVADPKPRSRQRTAVQRKITSTNNRVPRQAADQSDLPPTSDIPKMFDDLVTRAGKLDLLVDKLNGRKLRVATMCSGTESPLLALRMITRSLLKQTGKKLEIDHIFSCEIEPFKQAYIERNFAPPILFRDVLELADDYAYFPIKQ